MSSETGTKNVRVLARGRYLELVDENGWEYVRRHAATGVVVILATTDDDQVVLVEQPRIPIHRRTIELPAGLVGDVPDANTESLQQAAIRELEEETGFTASEWQVILEGPASVGISSEVVTFYRATGLTRVHAGGGDSTEDITVHLVPVREVPAFLSQKIAAGLLVDPKVHAGLHFLSLEKPRGERPVGNAPPMPPPLPPASPFDMKLDRPQGPLPFVPRDSGDGSIVWEYTVSPEHYNPYAVLHGGVVMALMDSAMGQAVATLVHPAGRFNAAAQMNVNFLAPVRSGSLRAHARVVKLGKRLAVVEAWAELADGTKVATATATHSLLP